MSIRNRTLALVAVAVASVTAMYGSAMAYVFTSTGITVESADVSSTSTVALQAVGSQFEILKFLGLFLLIGVAGYILNKVLSIKIG